MKKLATILSIFFLLVGTGKAQKVDSSLIKAQNETLRNMDSVLNSYYVSKSLQRYKTGKNNIFTDDHNIDVPDSVIIARLKKIPTPIEITYNSEVRSWINLYLRRGKYMIPTILGLSNYYFPMFEEELAANNMPLELKYLPVIESALNPRAVSRAKAVGIWQFMYGTGKRYNLKINSFIDERRDPLKSTKAAVKYLKNLYGIFNNWTLAIAAYNCGSANITKAIARSGKTDFWDIYYYLPRETRSYIPAFIAMMYIMNYPEQHNFRAAEIQLPLNTDTIRITDTLYFRQVSEVLNIPIQQIRDLNPQYTHDIVPGFDTTYTYYLRLPMNKITQFLMYEDSIYHYKDPIIFKHKEFVKNPPKHNYNKHYYQPCPKYNHTGESKLIYTVQSGDNMSFISGWFNVPVRKLKCWNKLGSTRLKAGQKLTIYVPLKKINYYKRIASMSFEQKQEMASKRTQQRNNLDPNYIYYTLKTGDNLYIVAQKFDDVSYDDLMKINNFTDADVRRLQVGQVIKIKKKN